MFPGWYHKCIRMGGTSRCWFPAPHCPTRGHPRAIFSSSLGDSLKFASRSFPFTRCGDFKASGVGIWTEATVWSWKTLSRSWAQRQVAGWPPRAPSVTSSCLSNFTSLGLSFLFSRTRRVGWIISGLPWALGLFDSLINYPGQMAVHPLWCYPQGGQSMVTHVRLFKGFVILKTEKFPFMLIKISCDLSVFFFYFWLSLLFGLLKT